MKLPADRVALDDRQRHRIPAPTSRSAMWPTAFGKSWPSRMSARLADVIHLERLDRGRRPAVRPVGGEVGHQLDDLIGRRGCHEVEFELCAHARNVSAWHRRVASCSHDTTATPMPPIVSRSEWEKARADFWFARRS